MDSRIREIEQWVTEAKTDLGEHGREAYLNKLYLLDAEIRSVIRESGMHPAAASPQSAGRRVRRQHAIPVFASGALGVLLAAVSTVYFASPGLSLPFGASVQSAPQVRVVRTPVNIPGDEQIVIDEHGKSYLTTLPGSPSEEKAGKETPSVDQAPAAGAAVSTVSSKPSALAQTPPQVPVTTSVPRMESGGTPSKPTPPREAPAIVLASASVAEPAADKDAPKPAKTPVLEEAVPVIPVALAADVNKPAGDKVDKSKLVDFKTLGDLLKSDLDS